MDLRFLLFLQEFRNTTGGFLSEPMMLISDLSTYGAIVICVVVYWGVSRSLGYWIFANCASGLYVNSILKLTACVYRPWIRDPRIVPYERALASATGYSFPSAHSQIAASFYGSCAVRAGKERRTFRVVCIVLILLVGFSRNFLGVHTPQDVLVSFAAGAFLLWAIGKLFAKIESEPSFLYIAAAAGIVIVIIGVLYFHFKSYPMEYIDGALIVDPAKMRADGYMSAGAALGFLCGALVEFRWIRFETDGTVLRRIIRVVLGVPFPLVLLLFIKPFVYSRIGEVNGHLVIYGILAFYIIALYPALFTAVRKYLDRSAAERA